MAKALVTGASGGIGRDIARQLYKKGYDLILVARNKAKLSALNDELGGKHRVIDLDISKQENVFKLFDEVKNENIEILVNNAGYGLFGEFDKTDLETELNLIDLNIKTLHILTKLFLPIFKQKNKGIILNVSSSAGFLPGPLLSTYYSSKAYVLRLSIAIREELRQAKSLVKICTLCPGPVKTGFDNRAGVSFSLKGLDSEFVAKYTIEQMFRGKAIIIPGFTMKLCAFISSPFPPTFLAKFVYHIQHKKGYK